MAQQQFTPPQALCSWPPSAALLQLHLLSRGVLVLSNIIGMSLLLAIGVEAFQPAAIVGGSFLTTSLAITPLIMLWNRKLLKRSRKQNGQYQQVDKEEVHLPRMKVRTLKVVTFLDGLGMLAFFAVFFPCILEVSNSWWYNDGHFYLSYSYGTVALLVAMFLHAFLFITEVCQVHAARGFRKSEKMICPHCNHSMSRVSTNVYSTPPESLAPAPETHIDMLEESLVDARISMNPGQETGTTFKTPRQSEHQSRAVVASGERSEANERGDGERDTLISKSE